MSIPTVFWMLLLSAGTIASCQRPCSQHSSDNPVRVGNRELPSNHEYEVVCALLDTIYRRESIDHSVKGTLPLLAFLRDSTMIANTGDMRGDPNLTFFDKSGKKIPRPDRVLWLRDHRGAQPLEQLELDTLASRFNRISATRYALDSSCFRGSVKVQLYGASPDGQGYVKQVGDWSEFRQRYPASRGLAVVSRVAFNDSLNQSMLYWEVYRDVLDAEGGFIFLRKVNGRWQVVYRLRKWAS
jgi:hypothetical protein